MAKSKSKKVAVRHHIKKLRKNKRVKRHLPLGILLLGVMIGFVIGVTRPEGVHPKSLVWAAAPDVQAPSDLVNFLRDQSNCTTLQDKAAIGGVSLWSIFKVSQGKFAKLSYGCSYDLTFYKMAIKENGRWLLLDKNEYFANNFLPKCEQVDLYKIDKSIEPFCLGADGASHENTTLPE